MDFFAYPHGLPAQFVNWRMKDGRKVPCRPDGMNCNPHDPANHHAYDVVKNAPYREGFVLTGSDPYFFIDVDKCAEGNVWSADAQRIIDLFPGAWIEVSQSGQGFHIIGKCDKSRLGHLRNRWDNNKEFYIDKRFIAFGGRGFTPIGGTFIETDWTDVLRSLVPSREKASSSARPVQKEISLSKADAELLERMLRSASVPARFGEAATFRDLWDVNVPVLAKYYPPNDPDEQEFDHSRADAALMAHLAYFTGCDPARMDLFFQASGLLRDKYLDRKDYRDRTIRNAIALCGRSGGEAAQGVSDLSGLHADMSHEELARGIFAARWQGSMLYLPERDRWAECRNGRWHLLATRQCQIPKLRQDLREIPPPDTKRAKQRIGDQKTIMAINALMQTNDGARRGVGAWDVDPYLLATPTQVVDLRTGQTRPRTARDFMLNSTEFDPAPEGTKPVAWLEYLDWTTSGDKELARYLQRVLGYAVTGSTKEQKLFFVTGPGGNGKGTVLNTILAILGPDYARTVQPDVFLRQSHRGHPTELASMKDARLIRASESSVGQTWDDALLKQLTGGDPVAARYMRQDEFTFRPKCTIIVDSNNAPAIIGMDKAMRRRIRVIPFFAEIPGGQPDPDISERLMSEAPAILRWLIDGARDWHNSGLGTCAAVEEATASYLDDEDVFADFIEEYFEPAPHGKVTNSELRVAFTLYAAQQGMPAWTSGAISKELIKRGFKKTKINGKRGFLGLRRKGLSQVVAPG